jgi:hypothetical protein
MPLSDFKPREIGLFTGDGNYAIPAEDQEPGGEEKS